MAGMQILEYPPMSHSTVFVKLDHAHLPLFECLGLESLSEIAALNTDHKSVRVEFRAMYLDSDIQILLVIEHSNTLAYLALVQSRYKISAYWLTKFVLGGFITGYVQCQNGKRIKAKIDRRNVRTRIAGSTALI